jgi:hypothetical protein
LRSMSSKRRRGSASATSRSRTSSMCRQPVGQDGAAAAGGDRCLCSGSERQACRGPHLRRRRPAAARSCRSADIGRSDSYVAHEPLEQSWVFHGSKDRWAAIPTGRRARR